MQIKLGGTSLLAEPRGPISASHPDSKVFGAAPKKIYSWWCDAKFGLPTPRPHSVYIDADLLATNQLHVDYSMTGRNSPHATREAYRDLLRAANLPNVKAIQTELNKRFPPVKVPIPYDKLIEPNADAESRDLYALQIYLRFDVGLDRNPKPIDQFRYPFVLQIPLGVQFQTLTVATCEDEALDLNYGFWDHVNILTPRSSEARELLREHNKVMKERRRMLEGYDKDGGVKLVDPDKDD